jgi:hypothetical protein
MIARDFQLEQPGQPMRIVPIEPLYSMLHDAPLPALEFFYEKIRRIETDQDLDDIVPDLGLTRRRCIEQVLLVLRERSEAD